MKSSKNKVIFREEQQSRQPWLWFFVILILVGDFVAAGFLITNKELFVTVLIFLPIGPLIFLLFIILKLITEVRSDGIYLRFYPLSTFKVPLEDLIDHKAVKYSPIKDYGGWGYKTNLLKKGKAFSMSGNEGVRLDYSNGKHIMIGSQQSKKLEKAISELLSKNVS